MLNHIALRPHDQISFFQLKGRWDVVGETRDGRYVLVVQRLAEAYQVIDREQGFRGALTGGYLLNLYAPRGPYLDFNELEEETRRILDQLEDGRELALPSLMPLWITRHWTSQIRGPVLDPEKLSAWACHQVWHWLQANGCRWRISVDEIVYIRGQHIEVDTWTIRNTRQAKTLWPRRLSDSWEPPQKHRRLRIRVPLSTTRKA